MVPLLAMANTIRSILNLVGQCCVGLFVVLLMGTRNYSVYTVPQAKPIQSHIKHVTHVTK